MQRVRNISLKRLWYYFRLGHNTYLALAIGLAQFFIITYTLFLQRFTIFAGLRLWEFAVAFSVLYMIASVILGWSHRRIQMGAEAEMGTLTNPYVFKISPGKETLLFIPLQMFSLEIQRTLMASHGLLSPKVQEQFDDWLKKLQALLNGEEFR